MPSPTCSDLRIVSLIASATEMVHGLGLTACQVARSHECDFPAEIQKLPIVTKPAFAVDGSSAEIDRNVKDRLLSATSVYEIDQELLEGVRPTHILTQSQCRVCAVSFEDVERALSRSYSGRPAVVALEPNCLDDICRDIRRVAASTHSEEQGRALLDRMQQEFDNLQQACQAGARYPRVACIEWLEPMMAAGNWVPEMVARAHAENLFGSPGKHSPWLEWSQLVKADPDVLLVMPCGFDLERTREEMYWLTGKPEWTTLRSVRNGEVYLVDGNQYMHRPGPRVTQSMRTVAEILHPELVPPKLENIAWERFER